MPYKAIKTKAYLMLACAIIGFFCLLQTMLNPLFWLAVWLFLAAILGIALSIFCQNAERSLLRQYLLKPLPPLEQLEQRFASHAVSIILDVFLFFLIVVILKILHVPAQIAYPLYAGPMGCTFASAGFLLYDISRHKKR